LPQSKFYEEEGMVKINPTQTTELNLKTLVYPLTFGIWNEEIILSDLTHQEESIIPETFTLLIDNSGNIRNLQYSGLISLNTEKLQNCLNLALARRDTILSLIDDGSKGFK
jgi:exosome complex RNA-binding protein Rrp42 (RNase PH superfamily)